LEKGNTTIFRRYFADFRLTFPDLRLKALTGKGNSSYWIQIFQLKITKLAKDNSVNAFIVLLAAFSIFLHRLSNQTSVIIGVPLTNE